jgi:amidohydrolase
MAIDTATIGRLVEDVGDELVGWRRHLHQNPELSFEEAETSRFVYETLESFGAGLELSRPTETSVLARLVGEKPGRTIAIRADMDALPVQEETGLSFASKNEGVMHACGHDGHTAILLGTAKVLGELREHVEGEVRFVFQHAEEIGQGAEELVEAGAIKGVDAVIGLHIVPRLEVGKIGIGYGSRSAAPDTFEISVEGEGGHAAWPQVAVDPVAIAAQVVTNLQHVTSREIDPRDSLVISVAKIAGGTAHNAIPGKVEMKGTVRTLSEEIRELVPEKMERIVRGVTEAHGAYCSFEYRRGPDPVVNNEGVTRVVEKTAREVFGDEAVEETPPGMGAEDFSYYQRVAPTAFFFLGAGNEEKGITYPNHSPRFDIDEDVLPIGVKMFVHAAMRLLDAELQTQTGAKGG